MCVCVHMGVCVLLWISVIACVCALLCLNRVRACVSCACVCVCAPRGGESSVRLRDEGRAVPGVDADERRRPQVPYLPHGRGGLRRDQGHLLRSRALLRAGGPAPREYRLPVSTHTHTQKHTYSYIHQAEESHLHSLPPTKVNHRPSTEARERERDGGRWKGETREIPGECVVYGTLLVSVLEGQRTDVPVTLSSVCVLLSSRDLKPENILLDDHGE